MRPSLSPEPWCQPVFCLSPHPSTCPGLSLPPPLAATQVLLNLRESSALWTPPVRHTRLAKSCCLPSTPWLSLRKTLLCLKCPCPLLFLASSQPLLIPVYPRPAPALPLRSSVRALAPPHSGNCHCTETQDPCDTCLSARPGDPLPALISCNSSARFHAAPGPCLIFNAYLSCLLGLTANFSEAEAGFYVPSQAPSRALCIVGAQEIDLQ